MGRLVALAFLLLVLCAAVLLVCAVHNRKVRAAHPSVAKRRKALEVAMMTEEITAEEYAEKKILLEREEIAERLTRRLMSDD